MEQTFLYHEKYQVQIENDLVHLSAQLPLLKQFKKQRDPTAVVHHTSSYRYDNKRLEGAGDKAHDAKKAETRLQSNANSGASVTVVFPQDLTHGRRRQECVTCGDFYTAST